MAINLFVKYFLKNILIQSLAEDHTVLEALFIQSLILFHRHFFNIDDHGRPAEGSQAQSEKGKKEFPWRGILIGPVFYFCQILPFFNKLFL